MKHRGALVTGSTSGIGKAIANRLSAEGFSVAFHSRSSVEVGQRLASQSERIKWAASLLPISVGRSRQKEVALYGS